MKQHDMTPLPPRAAPIAAEATAPSTAPAAATASLAAGVAAIDAAAPSGAGAGGADMLISEPKGGLPMPQGAAMRKAALDLLYENARERPGAAAGRDKVEAGHEPSPPAGRLWRERRLGRLFPPVPDGEPEELILESGAADWLLVVPVGATEPGNIAAVRPGKGRKSGGGGGGGRAAPPGAWFGEDAPGEGGDRLHRVAVVADTFIEPLRPPKMDRPGSLPALRPKSKAECERRCGSDGFCDPSAPLGCGGVHCGRQRDILD